MTPDRTVRAALHCHSTASPASKLGVRRALGLPECATPPEEVHELAQRRGLLRGRDRGAAGLVA